MVELGSEPSAAGGGCSEVSEWQRSARRKPAPPGAAAAGHRNRKTTINNLIQICGCGGIGRLIGFRFQRASVQVRVLSSAPKQYNPNSVFRIGEGFGLFVYFDRYEQRHFPNGVPIRPESKPRGPRKKKAI